MLLLVIFFSARHLSAQELFSTGEPEFITAENSFASIRLVQNTENQSPASDESLPPLPIGPGNPVVVPGPFQQTVNTVTGTTSTVGKSPAAVFVVTPEMIRRSGAQTLPEALRMVPGVWVTNTNSLEPNVNIRGIGTTDAILPISKRVLVLIDGREVYDPVAGGVLWSANDVVLQDIERIEVIRGPGATLWGANAVNGVINIITKSAKDTQGTLLQGTGGSLYRTITTARHGAQVSDNSHIRVYGKYRDFGDGVLDPNIEGDNRISTPNDGFHDFRGGFRMDTQVSREDTITTQGTIFDNPNSGPTFVPGTSTISGAAPMARYSGGSVQSQWNHKFENDAELMVMGIYDNINFANQAVDFARNSLALRSTYQWDWGNRQKWLAGARYRFDEDHANTVLFPQTIQFFDPSSRAYYVVDWLIQDEIQLVPDDLVLTVGTKMEVNSFSNFQIQPSARLLKTIDEQRVVWVSVSRAVRRPNRIEQSLYYYNAALAPANFIPPNRTLQGEALVAFELGYRAQPIEWFSWDIAGFYNFYDQFPQSLFSTQLTPLGPALVFPQSNELNIKSLGAELTGTLEMTSTWDMTGSYSVIDIDAKGAQNILALPGDVFDAGAEFAQSLEQGSPRHVAYLRNSWSPIETVDIDLINRYVDSISTFKIPSYLELDLRLAWRPRPRLEFAVMGMNLLNPSHLEYGIPNRQQSVPTTGIRTQVPRGVYGTVTYEF